MQEPKHRLLCAKQLTLTPSGFLLSKLLAAAERRRREFSMRVHKQSPAPEAPLTCSKHINQLRLSSKSRCKFQPQDPQSKATKLSERRHRLCKAAILSGTKSTVRGWRVDASAGGDEKESPPICIVYQTNITFLNSRTYACTNSRNPISLLSLLSALQNRNTPLHLGMHATLLFEYYSESILVQHSISLFQMATVSSSCIILQAVRKAGESKDLIVWAQPPVHFPVIPKKKSLPQMDITIQTKMERKLKKKKKGRKWWVKRDTKVLMHFTVGWRVTVV